MHLTTYTLSGYEGYFIKGKAFTYVCDNSHYRLEFKAKSTAHAIRRLLAIVRKFTKCFEKAEWYKFKVTLRCRNDKNKTPLFEASVIKNPKK